MTTASHWTCHRCNTVNTPPNAHCSNCGARWTVDLNAGGPQAPQAPAGRRPAPVAPVFTPSPARADLPAASTRRITPPATPHTASPTPPAATPATARFRWAEHGVTRYMCVAMQLDARLARKAVEEVLEEPRRAVASSPGVDLACVLAYALAARGRQLARDCALLVLLFLMLVGIAILGPVSLVLGFLIAWIVVAGELFYVNYQVIVPKLSRRVFDPAAAPPPSASHHRARLQDIAEWDSGNVTVHQGFAPFAGYGFPMESWSFAIRTDTPKEEDDPVKPFAIHDLYVHIAAAVGTLLPAARIQDRLFVNGEDLVVGLDDATRQVLLPDPEWAPAKRVQPDVIKHLRDDWSTKARPYLTIQDPRWEGELVPTHFLRFARTPRKDVLFVENSTSLLAPVYAQYRVVDTLLDQPTFRQAAGTIAFALRRTPFLLIGSIPAVFGVIKHAFSRKDARDRREIRHRTFNYGALISLREAASGNLYYRYYQKIDREMSAKVVSRQVLDSLIEFLEQHNIDTSELRERQNVINNSGMFVGANSSVSISDSAVAVGRNAVSRALAGAGAAVSGGGGHGGGHGGGGGSAAGR